MFADGDKFVGEFANDQFKKGVYTAKDGSVYKGSFRAGLKHGQGELELPKKLKYIG